MLREKWEINGYDSQAWGMHYMFNRIKVIKMGVDVVSVKEVLSWINNKIRLRESAYICVSNVHMCMETLDSSEFCLLLEQADLVVPDGRPIFWALKLLGEDDAVQVRGQDLMSEICQQSSLSGIRIGLYGGSSDEVLAQVSLNLKRSFPGICIVYQESPPFSPPSEKEISDTISAINDSDVDVLFVGIGCPKQERWMAQHKEQLNCVMLGVGAAFDFISGAKKHAPKWMQVLGLEWLFRLVSEPKRLWRRYLRQNPRFVWYFMRQWIFRVKY